MKAIPVLAILVLVAAATVVAYATGAAEPGVSTYTWTEPATLIVSGGLLIGAASAMRRLPF